MTEEWVVEDMAPHRSKPTWVFEDIFGVDFINQYLNHGGQVEIIHKRCMAPFSEKVKRVYQASRTKWRCCVCDKAVPDDLIEGLVRAKELSNLMTKIEGVSV